MHEPIDRSTTVGVIRLPIVFGAFGVLWGGWQAVLPDLARGYDLTTGPIGAMLTAGFAVSLPAMIGAGRLIDRRGARWGIPLPALVMAASLALMASHPSPVLLVAAIVLLCAGSGAYDVAINAAAMGDRAWSRPARLTLLHAAFSGGGVVGAVTAGLAVAAGAGFGPVHAALAVLVVAVAAISAATPWRRAPSVGEAPRGVLMALLPLAGLAALAFIVEGSMETWSAIYLRDELGAGALVGALGPASFHAAMFVGRLGGAGVAGRLGASTTLLVGGLMTLSGMAVALVVMAPLAAVPAMAVAALGASFVVPVVVSIAARRAGPQSGRAASYVLTLGYGGFLIGPSLVGVGGELVGLRLALLTVPTCAAIIALASRTPVTR